VLGIDVTHPSVNEERCGLPSIAAIVGNLDTVPALYGATVTVRHAFPSNVSSEITE